MIFFTDDSSVLVFVCFPSDGLSVVADPPGAVLTRSPLLLSAVAFGMRAARSTGSGTPDRRKTEFSPPSPDAARDVKLAASGLRTSEAVAAPSGPGVAADSPHGANCIREPLSESDARRIIHSVFSLHFRTAAFQDSIVTPFYIPAEVRFAHFLCLHVHGVRLRNV